MIGRLKGIVDEKIEDQLLIDVSGVGYEVFASGRTLQALPEGEAATIFIHTHVREDAMQLYGFATKEEKSWFELLSTVQGVGSRMALSLLSTLSPAEIATAIGAQDKTSLTRANGVGPKLAERIMRELKDKVPTLSLAPANSNSASIPIATAPSAVQDAVSALVNLGYSAFEAKQAVEKAHSTAPDGSVQQLIPAALQELKA